ncbi:MAG: GNAT family N-acetyltransferase [Alphaproteobacteria bacterium]|nr:GNAT family N-acetyltransferase [Alphaproteobacteria bacterium]
MEPAIIGGYTPGAIGRVAELHARYYSREWGFGVFFEAKIASEMSDFLKNLDPAKDGFWTARLGERIEGAITLVGPREKAGSAHLRWFILSDEMRGTGIGNSLIGEALDFCRRQGYRQVFLWTFAGLDAARRLYDKNGFKLAEQMEGEQWGKKVLEQRFVLELK